VEYDTLESQIKGGVCSSSSLLPHLAKVFIPHKIGRNPVQRHTEGWMQSVHGVLKVTGLSFLRQKCSSYNRPVGIAYTAKTERSFNTCVATRVSGWYKKFTQLQVS